MAKANLTAQRLREVFQYDQSTGVFARVKPVRGLAHGGVGLRVGCLKKFGSSAGYITIGIDRRAYYAHRLAWLYVYGEWPKYGVDHINGVKDDNRIGNLRDVPQTVNLQNQRRSPKPKETGALLGARLFKRTGRWTSSIQADGVVKYLGYFDTQEEAHAAYLAAKRRLHPGCTI